MAESAFRKEQEKYDYLQFVAPDLHNRPRGKIMTGKYKEQAALHGLEVGSSVWCHLHGTDVPDKVVDLTGIHRPNLRLQPCLDTLTPWPWVGEVGTKVTTEGRRVGNVLCDLVNIQDGAPAPMSPRQMMKTQLDSLRERHNLVLKSAFEYEFTIFESGTLEPLGGRQHLYSSVLEWSRHHELFCDFTDVLRSMGVQVSSLAPEMSPGQWEVTTEPQEGVMGGDVAFHVVHAVKGFFHTRGYRATFLSQPILSGHMGASLHLNHSLWKKEGDRMMESVMLDKQDPELLSPTARHWLAGILTHGPALAALCCPTPNCYRVLFHPMFPGQVYWNVDDRNAMVRVRNANQNVFFENRLPSGPCNPYLAIAATVAAGLDGLNRRLPCPQPLEVQGQLPRTLEEALKALEKDERLCSLLGDRFVQCYITMKNEYELRLFDGRVWDTEEKQIEFERQLYMENLQL